jgi:hypothetical protein
VRVDFYGLTFETPCVTFYLRSPWRAAALEHRLFDTVRGLPRVRAEEVPDGRCVHIMDPKVCRTAFQALARVLKGWQEDADPGSERRSWRWFLEGDSDSDGYDRAGEPVSLWAFLELSVERGAPGEPDQGEDIDFEGFSVRVWGEEHSPGA